jgi:cell division protein FtsB
MNRRRAIAVGFVVAVVAVLTAMAFDSRGLRQWFRIGAELHQLEARNADLEAKIDRTRRRVEALRTGPQALERSAHENGYVHADETLFQLK